MLKHTARRDSSWSDKSVGQKGFTLIELLVVIIILGILAGVVIFAVGKTQDNAKKSSCKTEIQTVRTGIRAWEADEENMDAGELSLDTLESDGYLDPPSGGEYKYVDGITGDEAPRQVDPADDLPDGCVETTP